MSKKVKRVLATGTFDLLHPGHLCYLTEAKKLGDELIVLVARDCMVKHKPAPIIPEEQRVEMVSALKMVDRAILGSDRDMFEPLFEIRPDVIALGYDQHFDEVWLAGELEKRGINAEVVRITSMREGAECSSRGVVQKVIEKRAKHNGE
ncbi:MAG: adenylyltransferase/cytidyltransferase family protein [Methermicoccaceae archaeon]